MGDTSNSNQRLPNPNQIDPYRIALKILVYGLPIVAILFLFCLYIFFDSKDPPTEIETHTYEPHLPLTLGNTNKVLIVLHKEQNPNYNRSWPLCDVANATGSLTGAEILSPETFSCSRVTPSTDNIFFLETSCVKSANSPSLKLHDVGNNSKPMVNPRQACSISSAAHHNPSRKVILLFTCPLKEPGYYNRATDWERVLMDLPNFFFGHVDLEKLYAGSSLLELYDKALKYSKHPIEHNADLLRLFVLYLYGGTYMDLDIISLRSLQPLGNNFAGFESSISINNAVLNFKPKHKFLEDALYRAMLTYSPDVWATIGPGLLTKVATKCGFGSIPLKKYSPLKLNSCDVTLLPVETFYPINGCQGRRLFNEDGWLKLKIKLIGSYSLHAWSHSYEKKLHRGSKQIYVRLAEQHCADVYSTVRNLINW